MHRSSCRGGASIGGHHRSGKEKKIAIFVEPSPFSHVSGQDSDAFPSTVMPSSCRCNPAYTTEGYAARAPMASHQDTSSLRLCAAVPLSVRVWMLQCSTPAHNAVGPPAGMKIRFSNLIKGLRQLGDDVMVVTPCINPPKTFHGAKASRCLLLTPAFIAILPVTLLYFPFMGPRMHARPCKGRERLMRAAKMPLSALHAGEHVG